MSQLAEAPFEQDTPHADSRPAPQRGQVFSRRLTTATLALLFIVLSIYLLERLAAILQPLLIACFILYALFPIKNWLRRRGLPTWMAYTLILSLVLGLLVGLGAMVYGNLGRLDPERMSAYEDQLDERLNETLQALGLAGDQRASVRQVFQSDEKLSLRLRGEVVKMAGTFFSFLTVALVVCVYLFFLLLELGQFPHRLGDAFGADKANATMQVADRINNAVGDYISVLAFLSLMQGVLSTLVMGVLRIEFFLFWGLLIVLLNFIPYIGSLVAISVPVAVAFLQYPDEPWRGLTTLVILVAIQGVVDYLLYPRLTGHKLGVSPLLVLLSLAFWGWLWGVVGMVLAVPLTVAIKIVLEQMDATRPIAILMRDR